MMKQHGYILIVVLMILSLAMMLVTNLYRQGFVQLHFDRLMMQREQARMLAFSGLECAQSQLLYKPPNIEGGDASAQKQADPLNPMKRLIPIMNRWQMFQLKKEVDGVNGDIKICIMSEAGKIPLNKWFDFSKRTFLNEGKETGDMQVYLKQLFSRLKPYVGNTDLFVPLEKYLKSKKTYVQDISQLLTIKQFQDTFGLNQFYEPPKKGDTAKRPVFLMDLFTLWGDSPQISVWYLTDSVAAVLGLKRVGTDDFQQRLKQFQEAFKSEQLPTDIKELWGAVFQDIYGKEFSALPLGSDQVLKTGFDSKIVSVLSYGTVGKVTYKLYGILQQVEKGDEKGYNVIRLYTL